MYVCMCLVCDLVRVRQAIADGSELAVDFQHGAGGQLDGQLQANQVVHSEPYIHTYIHTKY